MTSNFEFCEVRPNVDVMTCRQHAQKRHRSKNAAGTWQSRPRNGMAFLSHRVVHSISQPVRIITTMRPVALSTQELTVKSQHSLPYVIVRVRLHACLRTILKSHLRGEQRSAAHGLVKSREYTSTSRLPRNAVVPLVLGVNMTSSFGMQVTSASTGT
jgi:hypothetical protein